MPKLHNATMTFGEFSKRCQLHRKDTDYKCYCFEDRYRPKLCNRDNCPFWVKQ